jgi:hypothetical protein
MRKVVNAQLSRMALPSKGFFSGKFDGIRSRLKGAFAMGPGTPLSAEDVALLERVADRIVQRGMATPAIMFLESVGPMNFLGSQALHFFTPIIQMAFPQRDVERIALLLERRETLTRLAALIETRAPGRSR